MQKVFGSADVDRPEFAAILGERYLCHVVVNDGDRFERALHDFRVANVAPHEFDRRRAIIVVDQVENADLASVFEQALDDDFAEVAGTAGDQSEHGLSGRNF